MQKKSVSDVIYHSATIAIEKSNFSRKKAKIIVFDALGIIKSLKWGSESSQGQFTWDIKPLMSRGLVGGTVDVFCAKQHR